MILISSIFIILTVIFYVLEQEFGFYTFLGTLLIPLIFFIFGILGIVAATKRVEIYKGKVVYHIGFTNKEYRMSDIRTSKTQTETYNTGLYLEDIVPVYSYDTLRTRATLRFRPICRMRAKPRTSRTPNLSDFKAAFCRRTYCNPKQIGGILIAKLIVAEKPSVAMSYAKVLGVTSRQDGYLEGNGYLVSWCVGHLVELAPPNIYDAKYVKWSIADLPILPKKWQYLVSTSTKKQFGILQKLMHRPDVESVICATDAG